ncbi:hypothetical protein R2R35_17960 [Anaerocolumna sp. AGMB13020]|uniref:hypothetical protein n=1 Tax=Anaerocolumna sp. AGMB13020 TaxID=3081750 RepID=UPI002952E6C9|nr:hypothetical protein [Anaerocolumna sp. AGMB13020]WOO35669.1 hypothetical protein R2R35_17960 [Anaerocolumna sp. AGMB13020]
MKKEETNRFPYRQPQMTALTLCETARGRQPIYNKPMGGRTSYFFYWLLMLTLYGMDCKSFLDLVSERNGRKETEKGVTEEVFSPPVTPGSIILP